MVQKNLENHFPNVTYESLVGNSDFASKTQFSGNHMCKIRRECKVIMVYASPNQEGVGCGNETDQGYIVPPVTDSYYVPVSQIDPSLHIPPAPPTPSPYGSPPHNPVADNQYYPAVENQYYPVNEKMATFIEQHHPNYVGPYKYPPAATDFLCFSGDTKVWTDQGVYKRMSDLNVGDYVLSSN
uniref:Uncharacterized protein n=1 Tax=Acrobeloides nanus TaxID=290746 RepID=A0A914D7D8_9BILA